MTDPEEDRDAADLLAAADHFVYSQWELFGATAWEKYLAVGRCALRVTWTALSKYTAGDRSGYGINVVSVAGRMAPPDDGSVDFLAVVEEYDPETELVVMFIEDEALNAPDQTGRVTYKAGWRIAAWRFRKDPPPPELYARRAN